MSHSPDSATEKRVDLQPYVAAWDAADRLLRSGKSWSGRERNCVFLNGGNQPFADVSAVSGLDFPDDARGLALVDWDHDGDLDVWLRNRTAPRLRLMLNRLDVTSRNHNYLALRLQGTECNRDAIGARVEVKIASQATSELSTLPDSGPTTLESPPSTLIQTVRAGDAYLSQSSKWLHFGLGPATELEQVIVRWPGGAAESFTDVQANGRFLLVQGQGTARRWAPPRPPVELGTKPQVPEESTAVSHAFLPVRLPLPSMNFFDYKDPAPRSFSQEPAPLLVTFWASWCAPCLDEIRELAQHEEELRANGLNVLALTVDGLDQTHSSQPSDAEALLKSLSFPFDSAVATPELLDKLEHLENMLFVRRLRFAVPYSLLLDADGRLAAIYRGRLSIDTLLEDLSNLDASGTTLRDLALPFEGRWLSKLRDYGPAWMAEKWASLPYHEDTVQLLDEALAESSDQTTGSPDAQEHWKRYRLLATKLLLLGRYDEAIARAREGLELRPESEAFHLIQGDAMRGNGQFEAAIEQYEAVIQLDETSHSAWFGKGLACAKLKQFDQAALALEKAIELRPSNQQAQYLLGQSRQELGQTQAAESSFRAVLAADGDHSSAHWSLAGLLRGSGRIDEAVEHYRRAASLQPNRAAWRHDFAMALVVTGQRREAIPHFRETVRLEPSRVGALNALAWILATQPQPQQDEPAEAVELAQRGAELTRHQDPGMLDTLAVAYASAGDFALARSTAEQAVQVARQQQDSKLAAEIEARLSMYKQSKPYVEPSR